MFFGEGLYWCDWSRLLQALQLLLSSTLGSAREIRSTNTMQVKLNSFLVQQYGSAPAAILIRQRGGLTVLPDGGCGGGGFPFGVKMSVDNFAVT